MCFPAIPGLKRHPTELQQRDRLIDSRIYLNILNRSEVRVVVQPNDHPCPSAILLLASLLRVRVNLSPSCRYAQLTLLATCPQVPPSLSSRLHRHPAHVLYVRFHVAPTPATPWGLIWLQRSICASHPVKINTERATVPVCLSCGCGYSICFNRHQAVGSYLPGGSQ